MPNDLNLSLVAVFHDGAGEAFGFPGYVPPPESMPEAYLGIWRERITDHVVITSKKVMPFLAPYLGHHSWTVVISDQDFPGRTNARTPEDALVLARDLCECVGPENEVLVVVGERLRKHFLPVAKRLYVMRIRSRPEEPSGVHEGLLGLIRERPFFHHERLVAEPLNGWLAHVDLYTPEHRRLEQRIAS